MVLSNDSKATNQHAAYNGLAMRKFVKDNWKDYKMYGNKADNCYSYLRYAEILMTYAEAKNEMGQCTQEDLDKSINLVRERAYKGSGMAYPRVEVASQEALRKIIRMERRSEFAFEGLRYRDLLRWRIAEKSHNKSMYYLSRAWSGSSEWNGLTGSESNLQLSSDFMTILKTGMMETFLLEVYLQLMKTDYRIFHQWKQLDISPLSIKCHLILRKTIYGRFLPMIF